MGAGLPLEAPARPERAGFHDVQMATGQRTDPEPPKKNAAAVELGKRGGLKGGKARQKGVSAKRRRSPERRRERAGKSAKIFMVASLCAICVIAAAGDRLARQMGVGERQAIIRQLEATRMSRVLCCVTSDREGANGQLAKDFIPIFFEHLRGFGSTTRVDVFMFTQGGDTLAAFGLSRLVRGFTKPDGRFGVLVPEKCQSGGTLFLLGADEVVMTSAAMLSPIDPSIQSPLGPTIEVQPGQRMVWPVSVESLAAFLELARDDWKLSENGIANAFAALTDKLHPIVLGDVKRSRGQIEALATTLLKDHVQDETKIQTTVRKLTRELGSHDYLIFRDEAASSIGIKIAPQNDAQEDLIWGLYEDYRTDMELGRGYVPAIELAAAKATAGGVLTAPARISQQIVLIESATKSNLWRRDLSLSERVVATPTGPVSMPYQEITYNGWV